MSKLDDWTVAAFYGGSIGEKAEIAHPGTWPVCHADACSRPAVFHWTGGVATGHKALAYCEKCLEEVCGGLLADLVTYNTRTFGEVTGMLHERVVRNQLSRCHRWRNEVLLEWSGDDEDWRKERLEQLAEGLVRFNSGCYKINSLHDHEGQLTVTWGIPPTIRDRTQTEFLWGKQNEPFGVHVFPDGSEEEWER